MRKQDVVNERHKKVAMLEDILENDALVHLMKEYEHETGLELNDANAYYQQLETA